MDQVRISTIALATNEFLAAVAPSASAPDITLGGPGGSGHDIALSWTGENGVVYGVQTNANLVDGTWNTYTNMMGGGGSITFTNDIEVVEMFFRITLE